MSVLSSAFSSLIAKNPLSSAFSPNVHLPEPVDGSLMSEHKEHGEVEKCDLRIEGMTCGACVEVCPTDWAFMNALTSLTILDIQSIEGMLRGQDGIHSVKVALLAERGVIEFDPSMWTVDKIVGVGSHIKIHYCLANIAFDVQEINDIGFDATVIPTTRTDSIILRVYGMTCSSCTSTVESGLSAVPGITSAAVTLATETAKVEFDRTLIGPREIVEHIKDMGFDAMVSAQDDATQLRSLTRAKEIQEWRKRFWTAFAFALPVFLVGMVAGHIPFLMPIVHHRIIRGIYLGDVIELVLTTPAQFWLGRKFYRNSYKALKHGSATMDVLVTIGTTAAYMYSLFAMLCAPFNSDPDYIPSTFFDTSTMLIMFVSLGRYLENKAKGKTSAALTDLMALSPSMATIYTDPPACTRENRVATELLQPGDIVKIVPGDKVPADGTVIRGSSSIDESAVTGEPVPVPKQIGDSVIAGTVNGLGTFDMSVARAGKDTALAQIVKLVEDAQTAKAPIQAFADRVAGYFVPTVVALAALTFVTWMIISHVVPDSALPGVFLMHGTSKFAVCLKLCISVVVVACPCALGLSTPTAIMVGTGIGAQNGILIKGGRALEGSKNIRRIVFDKTGTVTEGKLTVTSLVWAPSEADADVSVDSHSPVSEKPLSSLCADGVTTRAAVFAMVAATEARSEHPLAKAAASFGKERIALSGTAVPEVHISSFESITGAGVKSDVTLSGDSGTYTVYVGSARFASQASIDEDERLPLSLATFTEQETSRGRTVIYVSLSRSVSVSLKTAARPRLILAIALSDVPKPSSARAIRSLQNMGLEVNMMTGDARTTALAIAREVGIRPEGVWADMSPKGKAKVVTELMEKDGGGVAMVSLNFVANYLR